MKTPTEDDILLVQTCGACPEQYDAFLGDRQVGYLRLRHGLFYVDFPACDGETIYETEEVLGDGIFDESEREKFLSIAKRAILRKLGEK